MILGIFLVLAPSAFAHPDRIVLGYSPNWIDEHCPADCINYDALTHLARAFIIPKPDGTLNIPAGYFNQKIESLARAHQVKLLMSIGGEAENADHWLSLARHPEYLNRFLDNLARLLDEHHYDGIDIDWEPSALTEEDGLAYTTLLKQLRQRFPKIIITTALVGSEYWVSHFSWPDVIDSVDYINVMVYTYSGAWGGRAAYASNLFPAGAYTPEPGYSADEGMRNLIENHHVPPTKLLMGVTFWASRFAVDHIGDTFPKNAAGYTSNITYAETMFLLQTGLYRDFWDDKAEMPYLERVGGGSTVCYENARSLESKVDYAKSKGCAGVMIWHVGADLDGERAPLMDALATACGAPPGSKFGADAVSSAGEGSPRANRKDFRECDEPKQLARSWELSGPNHRMQNGRRTCLGGKIGSASSICCSCAGLDCYSVDVLEARQRQVFRMIWTKGQLSRSDLHKRTGMTPNGVGVLAEVMLRDGLLRECPARVAGAGRPSVPLEVDPATRHLIGLALEPGRTDICRLGLAGNLLERVKVRQLASPARLIPTAAAMLAKHVDARTLGIGVSVTGFVDPQQRKLLFSSAMQGGPTADLVPIYHAARDVPVVLENDMHALAARWFLTHCKNPQQDVLLVWIADGRLGAAILVRGLPNPGCATGANDLGHTRYFVDTARCFCGHTGCLERIVSSDFLRRQDALRSIKCADGTLTRAPLTSPHWARTPSLDEMLKYLTCSLANAVNFVRPHRMVIVSELTGFPQFSEALLRLTRSLVLPQLVDRVQFDLWDEPGAGSAETAAWLAMAELLWGGWNQFDATVAAPSELRSEVPAEPGPSAFEANRNSGRAKVPAIAVPR